VGGIDRYAPEKAPLGLPAMVDVVLDVEVDVEVDELVVASNVLLLVDDVGGAAVVLLVDEVGGAPVLLDVVVTGVVVDVLLPHVNAPPAELAAHESQQLSAEPTHATPPPDGVHLAVLLLTVHFTLPLLSTRQHVTASFFPQVECAAHETTWPLHSFGRLAGPSAFTVCVTHFMYCPWFLNESHGQFTVTASRAVATAASSLHGFADATLGNVSKASPRTPKAINLIKPSSPVRDFDHLHHYSHPCRRRCAIAANDGVK
jgi:hypothetical protein